MNKKFSWTNVILGVVFLALCIIGFSDLCEPILQTLHTPKVQLCNDKDIAWSFCPLDALSKEMYYDVTTKADKYEMAVRIKPAKNQPGVYVMETVFCPPLSEADEELSKLEKCYLMWVRNQVGNMIHYELQMDSVADPNLLPRKYMLLMMIVEDDKGTLKAPKSERFVLSDTSNYINEFLFNHGVWNQCYQLKEGEKTMEFECEFVRGLGLKFYTYKRNGEEVYHIKLRQ